MIIVVDTSIIIAVLLNESAKPDIIELTKDAELIAPKSSHWEIANAFTAMFKRERMTLDQAKSAFNNFKAIPIRYPGIDMEHALNISYENNIYAYDAYFLSLSLKQNCQFITLDKSLQKVAAQIGIKIIEVYDDNI